MLYATPTARVIFTGKTSLDILSLRDEVKTPVVAIVTIHDHLQMVATFPNEMLSTYKLLM